MSNPLGAAEPVVLIHINTTHSAEKPHPTPVDRGVKVLRRKTLTPLTLGGRGKDSSSVPGQATKGLSSALLVAR